MAHIGDDFASFHSARGLSEKLVWETYVHQHVLPNASLHGIAETWWEHAVARHYEAELKQTGEARMYTANGHTTNGGRGCAIRSARRT